MKEVDRRGFMQNAAKSVLAGLIGSAADNVSFAKEQEDGDEIDVGEIPEVVFTQNDGLYLEVVDQDLPRRESFINLDPEDLERLEPEHSFRVMEALEYDFQDVLDQNFGEEYEPKIIQKSRSESREVLAETEGKAENFEDAWNKLKEDAEAASTEFNYIDSRKPSRDGKIVEVPGADIPESGSELSPGVYFGESFEAWEIQEDKLNSRIYDSSVLMVFESGSVPEDVLSEEEYFEAEDLSGDSQALR